MIPANATNKQPAISGAHRVFLPQKHGETVFWAFWSAERKQWSQPYHGIAHMPPSFDSMNSNGCLKWSEPGTLLHWIESEDEIGSDAHLARALRTGN